jgi:hypothetical protein
MANQQIGFEVVGKSNASEVMGKAAKEAEKLRDKLNKAFDLKGALTGAFIGAFGAAALLDKAINTVSESFKNMADVADQSSKAGISAGEFYQLSVAAEQAGVSTSSLAKAIRELRFMMKDAQTDTKKMDALTKGLGYTEEQVRSGNIQTIDVYKRVAVALSQVTTDLEKTTLVSKFFTDRTSNEMLPVLEAIGKNPDIFNGLIVASQNSYDAADKLDDMLSKLWHNIKTGIGVVAVSAFQSLNTQLDFAKTSLGWLWDHSPSGFVAEKMGISNPFKSETSGTSNASATQAQKDGAKFLAKDLTKEANGDNTIANSLGASMGNGPTSGVIGVGNNATFSLMEEQLDALKDIKDAIDKLGPISPMNTDFTKESYQNIA